MFKIEVLSDFLPALRSSGSISCSKTAGFDRPRRVEGSKDTLSFKP